VSSPNLLVSVSVADVRGRNSHTSELLTQAVMGVELELIRSTRDQNWQLVRLPDLTVGWIRSWSIIGTTKGRASSWLKSSAFQVESRSAAVREKPSLGSAVRCELVLGTRLPGADSGRKWLKIALPDSTEGWVERRQLATLPCRNPQPSSIVKTALRFMGVPYLWGGTTPWGCDCSGLVQTVYGYNGICLPRNSSEQLGATRAYPIEPGHENLKQGDLIFFGRSLKRITHVAISAGGSSFIHCRGSVRYGSLKRGELGYSLELSRLLRAATRPLLLSQKNS